MTLLITHLLSFFRDRLVREERGATTVEYGMLLVFAIAVGGVLTVVLLPHISDWLSGLDFTKNG